MRGQLRDTRTYVEIDGREYLLGSELDLVEVMGRIEAAARNEAAFVDLSDGDQLVSVLVSRRSRVVVTVRPLEPQPDSDDTPPGGFLRDWDL